MNIPFYKKKGWKITFLVLGIIFIVIFSYIAYIYASGKRIFDPRSLTASPFFKSISGKDYELRGEGDGRINILFLGMGGTGHPGGTLTDTILILSINPVDKTVAMISIPRDLCYAAERKWYEKVNQLYQNGESKEKGNGANYSKEHFGKILDLPIHYYVTADFYGFKKLIDQIGGIDVNVEKNLYDPYFPDQNMKGYDPFYIKAGEHHLDGETALKYARSRQTTSDFDRAARQQVIISEIKDKIMNLGFLSNPKKVLDLVDVVGDHIRTDFSAQEMIALAKMASELDMSKVASKVFKTGSDGELTSCGNGCLCPKDDSWETIRRIAHEIFTDPDLIRENASIEVLNATKTSGLAGKLAEILKSYNYRVVNIDNADSISKETVIYDYSNGQKEITLKFLQKRLDADVVKKTSDNSQADISIVIGEEYSGFTKDSNY